jgi:hypothetical protein
MSPARTRWTAHPYPQTRFRFRSQRQIPRPQHEYARPDIPASGGPSENITSIRPVQNLIVVDNWLDGAECRRLIADGEAYCATDEGPVIHGGRHFVPNTGAAWQQLCASSEAWRSLSDRLGSSEFLDWIVSQLDASGSDADLVLTHLFTNRHRGLNRRFKAASTDGRIGAVQLLHKLAQRANRSWMGIRRRLRYARTRLLARSTAVELLFDYSRASDGYGRVIHRDSDMRRYVFLLYLNSLDNGATGGNLDTYRLIESGQVAPAWPSEDECELVDSVAPAAGRLVVFRNSHDSYHGVSVMQGHGTVRHFLYGGFTQLGGTNPNILGSFGSIPTEFHLYA